MKHTSGPWRIDGRRIVGSDTYFDIDGFTVAEVFYEQSGRCSAGILREEVILNSHLIAAAPELLEALKHAVKVCYEAEITDSDEPGSWLFKAKEAIRKAEGD